jgi:hypothetical protein
MKTQIKIAKTNFQQGDVLAVKLDAMPCGEKKSVAKKHCVVAHGESGHSHIIDCDDAELIQIGERMLLKLGSHANLMHEEHKPITLSPGIWEIGRVQEYDYFAKMARDVRD